MKYNKILSIEMLYVGSIYKANVFPKSDNSLVLKQLITVQLIIFYIGAVAYSLVASSLIFIQALTYYFTREYTFLLPARLPFLNEYSPAGWTILFIYHLSVLAIAAWGTIAADFTSIMMIFNSVALTEVFRNGFKRFNEMCKDKNESKENVKYALRNLVLMHQYFRG